MGEAPSIPRVAHGREGSSPISLARFYQGGISAVLALGLTLILNQGLVEAEWVSGSRAHTWGLWLGLLCGAALAASQFRGRTALAYSGLLSMAAAGEMVGRILPSSDLLLSVPPAEVVWAMHLRLGTLVDRVDGWGMTLSHGEAIQDIGLFVFLLTLAVWNANAWLAWCVARRRQALPGLLPIGFILAVNTYLSGQSLFGLWLFILGAVVLTARTGLAWQNRDWDARRVDYPAELGLEWAGSAISLALVIGLAAAAAPLLGTPQGWVLLSDLAARSRQQTARAAERLFAGVTPPNVAAPALTTLTPNLEVIGAPPDSTQATVMWVQVSDPAPLPPQAGRSVAPPSQHYWRSVIFTKYLGAGWQPLHPPSSPEWDPSLPETLPGRYALRQRFEIVASHAETLFAANLPAAASEGAHVRYWPSEESALLHGDASAYEVLSWATDVREAELEAAPPAYPAAVRTTYLQLPESLPRRVRDLAARVTQGADTNYDKAIRLQSYLRNTYPYMLDVAAPPAGRDAVDYFLFEAPGGFCSYYASAMAVMLRAEGVPARVASGYAMGEYDDRRRAYRVPGSAAHAWVEVYFPDYGWVEFEPTPARAVFEYEGEAASSSSTPALPPNQSNVRTGWRAFAWMAGLVALLGLAALARQLAVPREYSPARVLYLRIRRSLARAGLGGSPSVTPDEYLAAYAPMWAHRPSLREAITSATALFLQATFSPHPVPARETQAAQQLWRRAAPEWLALWLAHGKIAAILKKEHPHG